MRTLKRYVGVCVSTGMGTYCCWTLLSFFTGSMPTIADKTAVVLIPRLQIHGLTRKIVKKYTKCFCHDEHGA